ncbi:MAG TPA: GNAT family N-acetyltransferase [Flavobacteriaceae bacterium]|nr:GNAT family N-acetyltransferase [Flavobacteriaceae bacterium]
MKSEFKPFPELCTKRLLLRQTLLGDRAEVFFLRSNEEVNKCIRRDPTNTVEDAENFIKKITQGWEEEKNINWSLVFQGNPEMIGSICLWNFSPDRKTAEVGYDLHPGFQKKGMMTEALQAVLKFGFEKLNLFQIEAFTNYQNQNSIRLLEKNGFSLNEKRKDKDDPENVIFELKRLEYFSSE